MPSLPELMSRSLAARDDTTGPPTGPPNGPPAALPVIALAIFLSGALLSASLIFIRHRRRKLRAGTLPSYNETQRGHARGHSRGRSLTIKPAGYRGGNAVLVIGRDGKPMLTKPTSPPHSPDNVPEIHITFPDEQDAQGRRLSGRVVVVRVGDGGVVGLEPLREEQLPAYEKEGKDGFYSLDMDRMGGLKEKDRADFH